MRFFGERESKGDDRADDWDGEYAIEFRDVHKAYGQNRVLDGTTMKIPTGKITMLMGPSGTGKSVCIAHAIGLTRPDSGDVRVEGISVPELEDHDLLALRKEKFGVLFQDGALFSSMNVIDNVAFPLEIAGMPKAERYARAREHYRRFVDERGITFGGPHGWQRFIQETCRSPEGRAAFQAYREQKQIALAAPAKLQCLERLIEQHRDDRILIFTYDNATVYLIARRFLVPAITHQTKTKERRTILERHPWVAINLYKAFEAGKEQAVARAREQSDVFFRLGWLPLEARKTVAANDPDENFCGQCGVALAERSATTAPLAGAFPPARVARSVCPQSRVPLAHSRGPRTGTRRERAPMAPAASRDPDGPATARAKRSWK